MFLDIIILTLKNYTLLIPRDYTHAQNRSKIGQSSASKETDPQKSEKWSLIKPRPQK